MSQFSVGHPKITLYDEGQWTTKKFIFFVICAGYVPYG